MKSVYPAKSQFNLDDFLNGRSFDAYKYFGVHYEDNYTVFRVYAPGAKSVTVIGDFNNWEPQGHIMIKEDGIHTLKIQGVLPEYTMYKFQVAQSDGNIVDKIDPFAFFSELRPACASKIFDYSKIAWNDKNYLQIRQKNFNRPVSIYEMHLGSWKRKGDGSIYSYEELAPQLVDYVLQMGFTHVEFLPLFEYPFDGSWGYQASGFYSLTSRYGNPRQLAYLIDCLHRAGIGVIFDFVPVHFVQNSEGLINFDGQSLFEYKSDDLKYSQWGSINFDLGKGAVCSFLLSAAAYLADVFHIDGIRIDAVSNIIYFDGNSQRGINEAGLSFLKNFNHLMAHKYPHLMLIAEDSSSYPLVCKPTFEGGLGFDYKWDLGWMNDTLRYMKLDPLFRKGKHDLITFSMHYFYNENFLLPLSHDEVVHMKGSIVNKMPGDYQMKFANARVLYVYQFAHPGKKLLFMGNELGEFDEWGENKTLNFHLLGFDLHRGINRLIADLNRVYCYHPALFSGEYDFSTFKWIKVNNRRQSLFIFARFVNDSKLIIVLNFTPTYYEHYRFGVPWEGEYKEVFNSDKAIYGGFDNYNGELLVTEQEKIDGEKYSIGIKIAPLSGIILKLVEKREAENV